ncbi:MAG TPA: prepilin-type N-terminal cleavage/methylation domain-containing protein [Chthoniobacteraceae bacterium]|nr:prepilin-type N-terminal cleavage/methylation domain-containing protein [Chthoniobacteraceae bacterium]
MLKGKSLSRAFTMIELLIVIVVIAILVAMLLPALHGVQIKANLTKAMSNMRQVGTAFMLYANDNSYNLPGRMSDASNQQTPKWPALLAGTDGSGTPNISTAYVQDVHVYIAPGDPTINPDRPDLFSFLTTNNVNNCSWIMNGYNDDGALTNPSVQIRTVNFNSPTETILLGVQKPGQANFYMDFLNGDNTNVLNLTMYNNGSPYLFADGSVKFITVTDYNAPAPQGTSNYGDWLWLSDKNATVPSSQ